MNKKSDNLRMYFVSDMEGCYRIIRSSKQSNYLCSKEFFDRLEELLKKNNKVAFLGDYFEGPECLFSIANMIKLHKKYKDNVHIILGNRDVNKLRLLFEITDLVVDDLTTTEFKNRSDLWNIWSNKKKTKKNNNDKEATYFENGFYQKLLDKLKSNNNNKEEKEKEILRIILKESMGTEGSYAKRDDFINLLYYIFHEYIFSKDVLDFEEFMKKITIYNTNNTTNNKTKNENIKKQMNDLKEIFNQPNKEYLDSIEEVLMDNPIYYLFRYGKLVYYDRDFKVLMSHGGGVDAIPTIEFYEQLANNLKLNNFHNYEIIKFDNYFKKIEEARKELQKININNIDHISNLIRAGNYPLEMFMKDISITNPYYYILQASGLKPDVGEKFVSYIESCDMEKFVKGPRVYKNNNIALTNLEKLKNIGVDIISYGHINFKLELPLIYSRELKKVEQKVEQKDKNRMVFIANDTSSFRPRENNSNPAIPISYIEKIGNNISNYKIGSKILDGSYNNKQNSFLKGPFQYSNVPELETISFTNSSKTENRSKLTVNNNSIKFTGSFNRNHNIIKKKK